MPCARGSRWMSPAVSSCARSRGCRSSSGRAYRGTALLLRDLLEEDDEYTGHHTEDVVELSRAVAERSASTRTTRRETELGALLHDIGKIAHPRRDHQQARALDDDEWAIMKTHTIEGQRMLDRVGGLLARSASSCAPRTSAGTAAATPTAWPARRSRSPRASSPPATPSTR
jgi:putative nucleotidyltransferase with HDIG domain